MQFLKKNILPFLLLLIFVWPSVVKLGHHHEHHAEKPTSGISVNAFQEKCTVCNFEFTAFSKSDNYFQIVNDLPTDRDRVKNVRFKTSAHSGFSFSLRAPPCKFI